MKRHSFELVTVASREGERLYLGHIFRFFQCFSHTPLVANASYARIGRYAIGLVLKPASVVSLLKAFILIGGRGASRPDLPPCGRLVPPGSGGVLFCVLFGSFL